MDPSGTRAAGRCGSDSGQRRGGGGSVEPAVPPVGCVAQTLVLLSTAKTEKTTVGAPVGAIALTKQTVSGQEDGEKQPTTFVAPQSGLESSY